MDSHMMKNTEWGACAYLSRSVYGKNGAVWNNPYYNNRTNYSPITGLCGTSQDASTTDVNNTYRYNTEGGINASTSGNVYGIFDMAGGSIDYTAGVLSGNLSNGRYYDFTTIDPKYYDTYTGYNDIKYGDAVYETSIGSTGTTAWDTAYSEIPFSTSPIFKYGGQACNGSLAGIFCFSSYTGDGHTCNTFRPCLVMSE